MIGTDAITHIHRDAKGVAWIDETNVKVIEVVLDWIAHGSSPEEMHFQHPHLSLAQIHASLAFYYDHQEEFDRLVASSLETAEKLAAQSSDSPLRRRLHNLGKLP